MTKIKIVTDSAAHLSSADIRAYDIHVLNPPILMDGKLFGYVNKISSEKYLQLFEKCSNKPVIGDISVAELTDTYNQLGEDGSQILSIHLSDKLSSTYHNAKTAASKSSSEVTVVNSQVTAAGLAYQVLEAAKMVTAGKSIADILQQLTKIRNNTRIFFSVRNNQQIVNNRIIGKLRGFLGKHANTAYMIGFKQNDFTLIAHGSKDESLNNFWKSQMELMHDECIVKLSILHSGTSERAEFLRNMLNEEFPFVPISIAPTNPEMTTFIGRESTGVTYLLG
ncbi:DegV family protein [Lentilactobacillus otakiensis]|uniref:DegV family protein n=1 Tax=Lentilactobacillus otakiensis DSM 19908 = JCM 15040 TaxID=1423780 RepID=S4PQ34_9LACO|nr:DegV family protein [Lentilactobacillus otakiensis]KRL11527.1 degV family protein [Lentilactobacillus otakiensis DSM 19908 = JCM 15040]MDV3518467.1 DegV family protein [Lentilactobacillus otakiensis]GAD16875.1 degV family protein [Lentilactobacillus otakiensis DSM 19908 = JCM 15040]